MHAAWLTFGVPSLVGQNRAFVNVTRDLLLRGYAEVLPAASVAIELLETIDGDVDVVKTCRDLKRKGYTLALDDFVYRPALDPLIPLADIIKIDFRQDDVEEQVTHRLLKYLGSAAFGFRSEIRSIRHGLTLLGREQTRKFVSLMAMNGMGHDKPPELLMSAAV